MELVCVCSLHDGKREELIRGFPGNYGLPYLPTYHEVRYSQSPANHAYYTVRPRSEITCHDDSSGADLQGKLLYLLYLLATCDLDGYGGWADGWQVLYVRTEEDGYRKDTGY